MYGRHWCKMLQKQNPKFPRVPSRPPSRLCSSRERAKWLGLVGLRAVVARHPGAQPGERPTASNEEPPVDFEAKINEASLKHEGFGIWQFEGKLSILSIGSWSCYLVTWLSWGIYTIFRHSHLSKLKLQMRISREMCQGYSKFMDCFYLEKHP